MNKNISKKIMVIGIILFLINFFPNISGDINKISKNPLNNFEKVSQYCDLVVVNSGTDEDVSVLLNNGTGDFSNRQDYFIGGAPCCVDTGDFNNDRNIDFVVTNLEYLNFSIFFGNGDGTFEDCQYYDIGHKTGDVITRDFNMDGILDIVMTDRTNNDLFVLICNGDGTFKDPEYFPLDGLLQYIEAEDFNKDGKLDIAITKMGGGGDALIVLIGNGDGSFSERRDFWATSDPMGITTGDYDKDGNNDIAISTLDNRVVVLFGYGNGSFGNLQSYSAGRLCLLITSGDFNKDKNLDIVSTDGWDDEVRIYLNNGNGVFNYYNAFSTGQGPRDVVTMDFNNDGNLDLATTNDYWDLSISILLGDGEGNFNNRNDYSAGTWPYHLAADYLRNQPPDSPKINGPTIGKAGTKYDYMFETTDPNSDDVYYFINWDDGSVEDWIGPFSSGDPQTVSHTWPDQGTYLIKAKAKDVRDAEGPWGEFEVTMPRNKAMTNSLLLRFLERFPLLEKLLFIIK